MSQDLIEELYTELNAECSDDYLEDASFDLSAKYDELRIQAAAIDGKYADIRIDIDAIKRAASRAGSETRDRLEALESGAKAAGITLSELNDSQVQTLRSLIQVEDAVKGHDGRVDLLEAKMTRAVEVITAHERSLVKLKKQRLTIMGMAVLAIAVGVWGNLFLSLSTDINATLRLNTLEQTLGI